MSNYNETNVAGTAYTRCPQFVGFNPYGGNPSISFNEEQIINLTDGEVIRQAKGGVSAMLTPENAADTIPVLDPTTGSPTGQTVTFQEVYALMYSVYIKLATDRDAAAAAPAP